MDSLTTDFEALKSGHVTNSPKGKTIANGLRKTRMDAKNWKYA